MQQGTDRAYQDWHAALHNAAGLSPAKRHEAALERLYPAPEVHSDKLAAGWIPAVTGTNAKHALQLGYINCGNCRRKACLAAWIISAETSAAAKHSLQLES